MLIVAGVVTSLAVFNGIYPAITGSSGAISSATDKVSDRLESRIDIIQVGDNTSEVYVWIKNVGGSNIDNIEHIDLFFGPEDDFYRVEYDSGSAPYWEYELEGNNSRWKPAVTLKITVYPTDDLTTGSYYLKAVIPNGISAQTIYSVE